MYAHCMRGFLSTFVLSNFSVLRPKTYTNHALIQCNTRTLGTLLYNIRKIIFHEQLSPIAQTAFSSIVEQGLGRVRTINSELNCARLASEAATDQILGTILENKVHSVLCSKIIRTENSNKSFDAYIVNLFDCHEPLCSIHGW